ncbi:DUF21-domain-containing protein [Patellaria atrata CBS 101060]|uniref:DUF21-domain-containing protein n=1 Tax=Patellaria atrata CBS 101060 TaxID=1346257 RepID=A0A9P4VLG7_9PEZI|nr:DUF21-domain-containing protein [Patellaria atrata CBS 101060]
MRSTGITSCSAHHGSPSNIGSIRPVLFALTKCCVLMFGGVGASPLKYRSIHTSEEDLPKDPDDPSLWIYLGVAGALVLLGGAFAGLTIALMGQDEIYLQVIATSGEKAEKKHARRVLNLLKKGKHWVLVTLLLSNVITNETLPIVLDRSLGGGWPAVLGSTVLIVIFGEIAPQSVCVRYGLPIGAWMSPFVLALMWIMSPVAWPTAKLLDWLLGEDHGTTYKKAGLKTLVTLHKTLGHSPDERLNQDEVTIISAVLDLKDKPVGSIMTPMKDVFTLSANAVLDEEMMDTILSAGYSRIPIHAPDNPTNFVGMLLVKMLITYDPEDAMKVREFSLATLPETSPETSCLDIVNFFQEGKSHMVLVSDHPGDEYGALGVVTLEDVIEELIGEEIIDESDVFIDVHKAIRRMAPAPRTRVPKAKAPSIHGDEEDAPLLSRRSTIDDRVNATGRKSSLDQVPSSPRQTTFFVRRRSSSGAAAMEPVAIRNNPELLQHLKHLGPSNAANKPKTTRINTVKIKPGTNVPGTAASGTAIVPGTIPEDSVLTSDPPGSRASIHEIPTAYQGGVGEGLVSPGFEARDATHVLSQGYGSINGHQRPRSKSEASQTDPIDDSAGKIIVDNRPQPERLASQSTIGSLKSEDHEPPKKRATARSGSITENIVDMGGVRKVVLETTSSSDNEDARRNGEGSAGQLPSVDGAKEGEKKKRRKKRAKKKKEAKGGENEPLLGGKS